VLLLGNFVVVDSLLDLALLANLVEFRTFQLLDSRGVESTSEGLLLQHEPFPASMRDDDDRNDCSHASPAAHAAANATANAAAHPAATNAAANAATSHAAPCSHATARPFQLCSGRGELVVSSEEGVVLPHSPRGLPHGIPHSFPSAARSVQLR